MCGRFVTGGVITTEQVGEVDVTAIARRNRERQRAGEQVPGLRSCNGNQLHGARGTEGSDYAFGGSPLAEDAASAGTEAAALDKELHRQRQAAERRAAAQLPSHVLQLLEKTRQALCADPFSNSRVGQVPVKRLERAIAASHVSQILSCAPPATRRPPKQKHTRGDGQGSVVSRILDHGTDQRREQTHCDTSAPKPTVAVPCDSKGRSSGGKGLGKDLSHRGTGPFPPASGASQREPPHMRHQLSTQDSHPSMAKLILASGQQQRQQSRPMSASSRSNEEGEDGVGMGNRRRVQGSPSYVLDREGTPSPPAQGQPKDSHRTQRRSPLQNRHMTQCHYDNDTLPAGGEDSSAFVFALQMTIMRVT